MRVPSGRATSGARSVLRAVFCGVFAIVGLVAGGCGNTTYYYGTVIVTVSADNPSPFTAYIADIASISFLKSDNTSGYGFSNSTGYGKTVDFAKLADSTELFGAPAVLEGTYTQVTVTMNYGAGGNALPAQIYVDIDGYSQPATLLDSTGATPGTISYTVKLDPAQPLVVSRATPVKLDLHFSMHASTILNETVSPITATVRPVLTASTQPDITKPLRTRGVFVVADTGASNFTINSVAFFDSASYTNAPQGAIQVQTNAQTAFNVNGVVYRGAAAGIAALSTLPINTIVQAYGALGDITQQKPVFNATEVYAGVAAENVLASRVTGTVASRTGNTFHLHNAELIATNNIIATAYLLTTPSGVLVRFFDDLAVTVNSNTLVDVDREPEVASNLDLISIGQKVEIEGVLNVDSTGTSSIDASGGLVRLTPTTAWGDLTSGAAGSATINLIHIGDSYLSALTFTGTGATTGEDADPTAYTINTGTVDLTGADTTVPWRFDGLVAPFGSAAPGSSPDFTATAVTAGSATEQVLEIEWAGSGTAYPFQSVTSSGLLVNIASTSLGTVFMGPATPVDLKGLGVSPTIVADGTLTGQFSTGNPVSTTSATTNVFQSFGAYVTELNSVLTGTNTVVKLVAVGHWEGAPSNTFTAYRIDVVQTLP
jgi:hypothetical protein